MTTSNYVEADRRRAMLAALSLANGYRMPVRAIRDALEAIGYATTLDRVRTDGGWLVEQSLAALANGATDVYVLTDRGLDVVMGRTQAPGVHRPDPGQVDALNQALAGASMALSRALGG